MKTYSLGNHKNENHPFWTKIYLVKVSLNLSIVKQDLNHRKPFWNFYAVKSERANFIFSYCCSFDLDFFAFIRIPFGHAVRAELFLWKPNLHQTGFFFGFPGIRRPHFDLPDRLIMHQDGPFFHKFLSSCLSNTPIRRYFEHKLFHD